MYLTETKIIRDKTFYKEIDKYCKIGASLYNLTNYNINQIYRITNKLEKGIELEDWESAYIDNLNVGIDLYNKSGRTEKKMQHVGKDKKTMTDFYFLNWYMRDSSNLYDEMPLVLSGQKIIQELCHDWKVYFGVLERYRQGKIKSKPQKPGYKDKKIGRVPLTVPSSAFNKVGNKVVLTKRLNSYHLKTNKENIQQIRLITKNDYIECQIIYKVEDKVLREDNGRYYSIDLGVNNLMTVVSNIKGINPIIINGRPLKAINQFYYKTRAKYQSICKQVNNIETTKKLLQLADKRNRKVEDYLHKVSRLIIEKAKKDDISKIVVGKNTNWKKSCRMGKHSNQNFDSIPFNKLLKMMEYKGRLEGIEVILVEESYTSGTSYIDNEQPTKQNYNRQRRIKRGLFKTIDGITINADVNGAYQILKKTELLDILRYKGFERVDKIRNAA